MITEAILSGLFGVADLLLGLLPEIEWSIDTGAWEYARDILSMICWLLPWETVCNVVSFVIALGVFRITVSFVRLIAGFIPFVG